MTPAVVYELLHARPGSYRRPCPECDKGPRDIALAVKVDERGATWFCHRCNFTGSASEHRASRIVVPPAPRPAQHVTEVPLRWSDRAAAIWQRTVPLIGTVGEVYLKVRGCMLPPADGDLRFLPSANDHPPCLVGRVTEFLTNAPLTLHFTKLKADGSGKAGTERDKLLLKGHMKKGGCVRLWPDDAVTYSLALAEGIESALSAAHLHRPAWAGVDAGNLADFPVADGIETLLVFADHDEAGIAAARKLVTRWRRAGRNASAWMPTESKADPNDAVRGAA